MFGVSHDISPCDSVTLHDIIHCLQLCPRLPSIKGVTQPSAAGAARNPRLGPTPDRHPTDPDRARPRHTDVRPGGEITRGRFARPPVQKQPLYSYRVLLLGVPSKNIAGKSNLAPLRPRAAPIAPMGRHNGSGGQIFNGIVFGGDVASTSSETLGK